MEALQILEAAEDRTAWGSEDYAWDPQTCKAVSKSTSPKEHHPCGAPANLAQTIPQISGEIKPKTKNSAEPAPASPPQDTSDGSGVTCTAATETAEAAAAPVTAGKQGSSASHGRPGYCQADGCGKNLSKLTFYHVRNKICDVHIKVDEFSKENIKLRFCQRCGHPHELAEFDGTKHSCRAQLEKHNARRRKRQAEAAAKKRGGGKQTTSGEDLEEEEEDGATHQRGRATAATKTIGQSERNQEPTRRSSRRQKTRFTVAEMEMDEDEEEEQQQKEVAPRPAATVKVPPKKTQQEVKEKRQPSPALPLLDFNPSAMVVDHDAEPLEIDDLSVWLGTHLAELEDLDPAGPFNSSVLAPPLPQGTSSFNFASGVMQHPRDTGGLAAQGLPSTAGPSLLNSIRPLASDSPPLASDSLPLASVPGGVPDGGDNLAPAAAPRLTREAVLSTVSVKLFGCTPSELPINLREQLTTWFRGHAASLEGYLRPGCVHLTVQATVEVGTEEEQEQGNGRRTKKRQPEIEAKHPLHGSLVTTGGVSCLIDKMFSSGEPFWRSKTLLVQVGSELALVHGGALKQIWQIGSTPGERAVPAVLEMKPAVLLATTAKTTTDGATTTTSTKKRCCGGGGGAKHRKENEEEITIKGVNLLQDDCEIVCRLQGEYITVESAGCAECCCTAAVKACCQGSSGNTSSRGATEWESKCCGCCIAKLSSLSVSQESEKKTKKMKKSSSCCGTSKSTTAKAVVDAVTPQVVSLKLDSSSRSPLRPGVLHFDVIKNTFMAPQGGRVLVVDSPAVHTELLDLVQRAPAAAIAWIDALGVVFEWVGDKKKIDFPLVERTAAKLLHEAIHYGLVEVAKYLHGLLQAELMAVASSLALPQGMDGLDALAFLSQADQSCKKIALLRAIKLAKSSGVDSNMSDIQPGMTLLHLAVQSQNPDAVELVLGWGRESDVSWRSDLKGPCDLTPLHLAALARDPVVAARMILSLVASCEPGMQAWKEAVTTDGLSPADFACRLNRNGLLATFGRPISEQKQQQQLQQQEEEQEDVLAALVTVQKGNKFKQEDDQEAPSTPRRCRCTGPCPCATSAEPCASCGSSDDEACCGSENGQCCCCSGGKTQEEAEMQQAGGCCAATTLVRACCQ
jgi:hypothetical protein